MHDLMEKLRREESLWDLFTKAEEYRPVLLDQFNRFPYYASRQRDVLKPIVSKFLIGNGLKIKYPQDKTFGICLTHDIDSIYLPITKLLYESGNFFRKMNVRDAMKSLQTLIGKNIREWNPILNFWNFINSCSRGYINVTQYHYSSH